MKKVLRIRERRKTKIIREPRFEGAGLSARIELIQALIPIGLKAVGDERKEEVQRLDRRKYNRNEGLPAHCHWGNQLRSIHLRIRS